MDSDANQKKTGPLKKTQRGIERFLNSEEGKMLDSDIIKAAIVLGAVEAALIHNASPLAAQQGTFHNNWMQANGHQSHVSHGSHGSHGSSGGWC